MSEGGTPPLVDKETRLAWPSLHFPASVRDQPLPLHKFPFSIGRAPSCSLSFRERKLLSARHVELTMEDGKVKITDLSSNGTTINGSQKLSKGESALLKDGDVIHLIKKNKASEDDFSFTFVAAQDSSLCKQTQPLDSTLPMSDSEEPAVKVPRLTRVKDDMKTAEKPPEDVAKKPTKKEGADCVKDDDMAEQLQCAICTELIHDCVTLQPCLHSFCSGCYSGWMSKSPKCPEPYRVNMELYDASAVRYGDWRVEMLWMTPATQELPPGCPRGLDLLLGLDTLFVRQSVDIFEVLTGFEQANRYEVFNVYGQRIYMALENSDICQRMCCGSARGFEMALVDSVGVEMIHLSRPFVCQCACCCTALCCLQEVTVTVGGAVVGSVKQRRGCDWSDFELYNEAGSLVLTIDGPCCICGVEEEFALKSADGVTKVGRIAKQWSGLLKEMLTDADNFGINFPADLDVKMKATVLGACFLIDFMFFEKNSQGKQGAMI